MLWNQVARTTGAGALAFLLMSAFTPLWNTVASTYVGPVSIDSTDAIVVLSASLSSDQLLSGESLQRVLHGIELYKRGLAPMIVLSGGGRDGSITEAELRAKLARDMGVPVSTIVVETMSNTTQEESVRIGRILQRRRARRILLVTESLHMRRATLVFKRAGFQVVSSPSDDYARRLSAPADRLWLLYRLVQESAGLAYYAVARYI